MTEQQIAALGPAFACFLGRFLLRRVGRTGQLLLLSLHGGRLGQSLLLGLLLGQGRSSCLLLRLGEEGLHGHQIGVHVVDDQDAGVFHHGVLSNL